MKQLNVYHWVGYREGQTAEFVAAESIAEVQRLAKASGQSSVRRKSIYRINSARYCAIARQFPKKIFHARKSEEHQTTAKYFRDDAPLDGRTLAEWLGSFEQPSEEQLMSILRASALVELLQEATKTRQSLSAYERVLKALRVLQVDPVLYGRRVLYQLEYHDRDGDPNPWLAKKLAERSGKK